MHFKDRLVRSKATCFFKVLLSLCIRTRFWVVETFGGNNELSCLNFKVEGGYEVYYNMAIFNSTKRTHPLIRNQILLWTWQQCAVVGIMDAPLSNIIVSNGITGSASRDLYSSLPIKTGSIVVDDHSNTSKSHPKDIIDYGPQIRSRMNYFEMAELLHKEKDWISTMGLASSLISSTFWSQSKSL